MEKITKKEIAREIGKDRLLNSAVNDYCLNLENGVESLFTQRYLWDRKKGRIMEELYDEGFMRNSSPFFTEDAKGVRYDIPYFNLNSNMFSLYNLVVHLGKPPQDSSSYAIAHVDLSRKESDIDLGMHKNRLLNSAVNDYCLRLEDCVGDVPPKRYKQGGKSWQSAADELIEEGLFLKSGGPFYAYISTKIFDQYDISIALKRPSSNFCSSNFVEASASFTKKSLENEVGGEE